MTQHITIPLPDGLAPSAVRRIAVEAEGVVNRRTGALVDAHVTDLAPLTDTERRLIVTALDLAVDAQNVFGPLHGVGLLLELRHQLDPDSRAAVIAAMLTENGHPELTRQQDCAADAMAAEYGRSRVRHLSDGAVVITGMTDDVERRTVCVERDGRERWRS